MAPKYDALWQYGVKSLRERDNTLFRQGGWECNLSSLLPGVYEWKANYLLVVCFCHMGVDNTLLRKYPQTSLRLIWCVISNISVIFLIDPLPLSHSDRLWNTDDKTQNKETRSASGHKPWLDFKLHAIDLAVNSIAAEMISNIAYCSSTYYITISFSVF